MKTRTFYALPALLRCADRLAADCDTISLDLFDTILIRRVPEPNMIKVPVARFIAARARAAGLRWSGIKVLEYRNASAPAGAIPTTRRAIPNSCTTCSRISSGPSTATRCCAR